jgi:predicted MFS family arabinose efflux permease
MVGSTSIKHMHVLTYFITVLGLIIGALFVQFASWRWMFWFVAIAALASSIGAAFLVPKQVQEEHNPLGSKGSKLRRLDIPGVSALTGWYVDQS